MTAAPEIPADVMAAAVALVLASPLDVPRRVAVIDAIARAILAERRRCVEAVNAERLMDADENLSDADPTDIAYDMAIDHAIDANKRLST